MLAIVRERAVTEAPDVEELMQPRHLWRNVNTRNYPLCRRISLQYMDLGINLSAYFLFRTIVSIATQRMGLIAYEIHLKSIKTVFV